MRLFFGALVLNFMVFFNEIEASGLNGIKTGTFGNDPEGVDTHLLAQQASGVGRHQSYYPQFFYPQSHGYHPHPLEYWHQGSSTEPSGLSRASTMAYQNDGLGIDHLATSRFHMQPFSTHYPTSLANDALNLNVPPYSPESFDQQGQGHHSYTQEAFHPLNPAEIQHVTYKFNFRNGRLPEATDHQEPEHSQEYSKLDNVEWLLDQTREAELEAYYQQCKDEEARTLVHDETMRSSKNMFRRKPFLNPNREGTSQLISQPSIRSKSNRRLAKKLKEQEMIQEENPKKQRGVRIREPVSSQNNLEENAMNEHAPGEIGSRGKAKAASRRNDFDLNDPVIEQSQSSEHHFQNSYPVSIPSRMSGFRPYIRRPPNDPNDPQHWNHPGGSGSNYKK